MSSEQDDSVFSLITPHLNELRRRMGIVLLVLVVSIVASFAIAPFLMRLIAEPIGGLQNLQSIQITENASVYLRVAALAGFIPTVPVLAYQLLAFIMPGLMEHEKQWLKRYLFWFILLILLLFMVGVLVAFYLLLPPALKFLTTFLEVETNPRLSDYFEFVTNLVFWIGVVFEMPLVSYLLARLRIISAGMLLRGWRIAIVIIAVAAAVITPTPDPWNMGMLMLPLMILYVFSILMAKIARPQD